MKANPNKGIYKKGHIVTLETKKKLSKSKKGCIGYWAGKSRSKETKQKISEALFTGGAKESGKRRYYKSRKYNLKYQLNQRMREGFHRTLRSGIKNGRHWEDLVSYNFTQLMNHLQKTLPQNYTWNDFLAGRLHIDHIIPIAAFNFNNPDDIDFQRCWALDNLQLLPAKENRAKRDKLKEPFQPTFALKAMQSQHGSLL